MGYITNYVTVGDTPTVISSGPHLSSFLGSKDENSHEWKITDHSLSLLYVTCFLSMLLLSRCSIVTSLTDLTPSTKTIPLLLSYTVKPSMSIGTTFLRLLHCFLQRSLTFLVYVPGTFEPLLLPCLLSYSTDVV